MLRTGMVGSVTVWSVIILLMASSVPTELVAQVSRTRLQGSTLEEGSGQLSQQGHWRARSYVPVASNALHFRRLASKEEQGTDTLSTRPEGIQASLRRNLQVARHATLQLGRRHRRDGSSSPVSHDTREDMNGSRSSSPDAHHLLKEAGDLLDKHTLGLAVSEINTTVTREPGQAERLSDRFPEYRLTKERIQKVAAERDGVVIVTWANYNYLDFVENWLLHMKKIKVTTYMIGTMDERLLKALIAMGETNAFVMDPKVKADDLSFGSPHFIAMGREHCLLMEKAVGMGVDVLFSDIDTVWLRDPFPYLARYPDADILQTADHLHNTSNTDALERVQGNGNIGILLLRKTALGFAQELNFRLANDDNLWEQHGLGELITRNISHVNDRTDRLFRGYNGTLLIGTLPVALFASGHTHYIQGLSERMGIGPPYVVHNTFQFSGTAGKRHRFREHMLWLVDPDEYYDPPGGLLSFDLQLDGFLEAASHLQIHKPNLELDSFLPHFHLVNQQLSQLRSAMAIASVLNRTLVLPHLWSGSDRWWAPFSGIVPGAQYQQLPRQVPADLLLEIDMMSRADVEGAPPTLWFREYSFLENPRLPASTLDSSVRVVVCQEDDIGCEPALNKAKRQLQVRSGLSDLFLLDSFEEVKDVKLLHFTDMRKIFKGFSSEADTLEFQARTSIYPSIFCCVKGSPGHVWYDMWWDQDGHVDRHGRFIDKWKPMFGP